LLVITARVFVLEVQGLVRDGVSTTGS